jgi:hypothetical protein
MQKHYIDRNDPCWENVCTINAVPYFFSTSSQEKRYCCDKQEDMCQSIEAVGMAITRMI